MGGGLTLRFGEERLLVVGGGRGGDQDQGGGQQGERGVTEFHGGDLGGSGWRDGDYTAGDALYVLSIPTLRGFGEDAAGFQDWRHFAERLEAVFLAGRQVAEDSRGRFQRQFISGADPIAQPFGISNGMR